MRGLFAALLFALALPAGAGGFPDPAPRDLCPVCGMVVSKYPAWIATVVYRDGHAHHFDGAKDLFKYLFDVPRYARGHRASDIARSMVMEYGMSDRLGLLTYTHQPQSRYLDLGLGSGEREYSERTAQEIDEEVSRIVMGAYENVRRILHEERESLECLARVLLEKEVIEGEELKKFAEAVKERLGLSEEDVEGQEKICRNVRGISFH